MTVGNGRKRQYTGADWCAADSALDGAGDARQRAAADPDRAVGVAADVNTSGPPAEGSLACGVRGVRTPGAQQPLRKRGVEAPSDRILDRCPVAGREGANLEGTRRAFWVRTDDAKLQIDGARSQPEHGARVGQQDRDPPRAVVGPRRVEEGVAVEVEQFGDVSDEGFVDRARSQQRGRREGESVARRADPDQSGAAFLDDDAVPLRRSSRLEPRVTGSERGVTG